MSLHISLCHLESHSHLTASFDSRVIPGVRFRDHLGVVNFQVFSLLERAEEFKASVLFNRSEHSNRLLHNTRLDGNVRAAVGLA